MSDWLTWKFGQKKKFHFCALLIAHWGNWVCCRAPILKGVRKRGDFGVKTPLEFDILQKLYYLRKEINCFRILFAVNLST